MLQVILGILKIIGYLVVILLSVILLLCILTLFCPVRYHLWGEKEGETYFLKGKCSWILHFVSLPGEYREGKLTYTLKILGIPIKRFSGFQENSKDNEKKKSRRKKKKKETLKKKPKKEKEFKKDEVEKEQIQEKAQDLEVIEKSNESKRIEMDTSEQKSKEDTDGQEKEEKPKKKGIFQKISAFLSKVKKTWQGICDKIKGIKEPWEKIKELIHSEEFKESYKILKREGLILLRHVRPRKIEAKIHFGMDDPATTGYILGGVSLLYPIYQDHIKIMPDFEEKCLEGSFDIRGRIQFFVFIRLLWRLYKDKNIKKIIDRVRK